MAANPENAYLASAQGRSARHEDPKGTVPPEGDPVSSDYPQDLLQTYNQLSERYRRTTNALASAAHDLKTPLAILNGYVELQFEQGDMNGCLSEVCRRWSPRFQEMGVALYFVANDKLVGFPFDSAKVQRVVSNLLENACKFTPSGGTVWLHAEPYMWERRGTGKSTIEKERRRQPLSTPNAVKVSVADTGPGIPPEYHVEVFDDFFRLPSDQNQSEGMGLGLAIARRLVNGMGGKVWVESEPGAGSKFSFLIPLKPPLNSTHKGKSK